MKGPGVSPYLDMKEVAGVIDFVCLGCRHVCVTDSRESVF